MKKILSYLIFFPSLTFSLIKAEVFPYGILYIIADGVKIYKDNIKIVAIILISILWGVINYQYINGEIFRSASAYLNSVLIFFAIKHHRPLYLNKTILHVFYLMLVIGILQASGLSAIFGIDRLTDILITRGSDTLTDDGRGIAILSSEPSRAASEILFIYLAIRYTVIPYHRRIYFDLMIIIFMIAVIRSATGLLYLTLFLLFEYKLKFIIIFMLTSSLLLVLSINYNIRALNLAFELVNLKDSASIINHVINTSGFRAISVYSAYKYSLSHIFGAGVGFWQESSLQALNESGFSANDISFFVFWNDGEFYSVRPTSFISTVALDMGIIGILVFSKYIIIPLISFARKIKDVIPLVAVFLFYILFLGTVGNPIPWICIAYVISLKKNECLL